MSQHPIADDDIPLVTITKRRLRMLLAVARWALPATSRAMDA